MEELIGVLLERLTNKGMKGAYISPFIRNVANSIVTNQSMSLRDLSDHLKLLGWDDFELDDYTFHLITTIFMSRPLLKETYGPCLGFGPKDLHKLTEQAVKA